ncbi:MAG: sugar phosphate isomerase/epimerase family protein [Chitinophagales bacterium]
MRVGLSMWSLEKEAFAGKLSTVEFIRFAGTLGLDGVEVLDCFWRDEAREVPEVRAAAAAEGLAIAAYAIGNDFVTADTGERAAQLAGVKHGVDVACELGTGILRVFSGNAKDDLPFATARNWIREGLAEAAAYAEQRGVTLALENHGLFAGRSAQVIDLIEEIDSPALRATADTANFLLVGEEPHAAVAALKGKIAHVHLKDFRKVGPDHQGPSFASTGPERYTGTVVGEGEVRFDLILRSLREAGFTGFLSLEYEGTGDPRAGVERSLAKLKAML